MPVALLQQPADVRRRTCIVSRELQRRSGVTPKQTWSRQERTYCKPLQVFNVRPPLRVLANAEIHLRLRAQEVSAVRLLGMVS